MTSGETHPAQRQATWSVGAVALAVALIGTIGTAAELGPESLSPVATGAWRATIGALGMLAVCSARKQFPWRYRLHTKWILLGGYGVASSQLGFFEAVSRTGVALGTLVAIGIGPLAAAAIDWLAYRSRPGRRWVVGVVVALGGVALLTGATPDVAWAGVIFAVIGGVGIPCQGFAAQQLMRDRPVLPAMATMGIAGAIMLSPIAIRGFGAAFDSTASVTTIVYLGLITITLAHTLWGAGLRNLSLSVAAAIGLLEPAVAAVLAVSVLNEPLTLSITAGILLVIGGIAITSISRTSRLAR